MSVAQQLYRLQETDLEIEAKEQSLRQASLRLGEDQELARTRERLEQEGRQREALSKEQHTTEWEIDDLVTKVSAAEETLYSGRIKNPKELANLQHEVELMKAKRNQVEDKALEIMDRAELAEANVAAISEELKKAQEHLSAEIDKLKTSLAALNERRQRLLDDIEPRVAELYQDLRLKKGRAVARVEQGVCTSCRLSLPMSDLQRARIGDLIQCSSCGRILFQA